MDIAVPTLGRALLQESIHPLLAAGLKVHLVVDQAEADKYDNFKGKPNLSVVACPATGIGHVRQWIVENIGSANEICMVDDDLTFFRRRDDDRTKLRDITLTELQQAFASLRSVLGSKGVAHAGFATREGANRCTDKLIQNTRILRVLAYRRDVLAKECITFGRIAVMEDFDVALRLLRAGYKNVVLNEYTHNQRGSGSKGGCSTYRTLEVQARAAHQLASMHPGFVKVVTKTTKTAWGGGTRTDVQIAWKKAYTAGAALRGFTL